VNATTTAEREAGPRTAQAAFTLLEVLAAVMILSLWYVIIANSAILGLRAEGGSQRRMEAGRIADEKLAELESLALAGTSLEDTNETEEVDGYEVKWAIAPFTLAASAPATDPNGEPPVPKNLREYFVINAPGISRLIRAVTVRVAWFEGEDERAVVRSTFVFNEADAAALYDDPKFGAEDAPQDGDAAAPGTGARDPGEDQP
jgi:prepilin-type N-terminal cleavage/methylation domain-containing protein